MKKLQDILNAKLAQDILGSQQQLIDSITLDSRQAKTGSLFVAMRGTLTDGHTYIPQAIAQGCSCIVCEELPKTVQDGVCYIQVADSALALAEISSAFYGSPSHKIKLVGVTGTNGKTTTATLLYDLFRSLGYKVGLLSTVSYKIDDNSFPASHTTPDSIRINALLNDMVEAGCEFCFMEVSSHAVVQQRTAGLRFVGGIFTNITHDHLDYHKTFRAYIEAKKTFFDQLPNQAFALSNCDDKNGQVMLQNTKAAKYTFGLRTMGDYKASIIEHDFTGMQLILSNQEFWTPLVGEFNAYNILGVYATACLLGADSCEVLQQLSKLSPVDGRFELIRSAEGISAVVDYAHTPDALVNVLKTINQVRNESAQLITVVGAGGNRDKTKRPEMAKAAALASNKLILTSDNPRGEDPEAILDDMQAGVPTEKAAGVLRIANRKEAIRTAVLLAKPGDLILVAGKGHETYQEVNGVRHHFDDREVLREIFNIKNS